MQTSTIIAIAGFVTSIIAIFLSGFLAPRFNAFFEKQYQDRKVLKKTLRTLLEVELYIHRKLPHPSISIVSDILIKKMKELNLVTEEQQAEVAANLPQFFQLLQPHIADIFPDQFEKLDEKYNSALEELATVNPIMAFQIGERHLLSPIQQINGLTINLLDKFGIKAEENDLQQINELFDSITNKSINDLQTNLRNEILQVADKIGKKTRKELEAYFLKRQIEKQKEIQHLVDKMTENVLKNIQSTVAKDKTEK